MALRFPRLQFSLRTLVILVVIVAAATSWQLWRYRRHEARQAAKTKLESYGFTFYTAAEVLKGAMYYEHELDRTVPEYYSSWDKWCFGAESTQAYPGCKLMRDEPQEKTEYPLLELFRYFPELQITWTKPNSQIVTTALPHLRHAINVQIDDLWVQALREHSPLLTISGNKPSLRPESLKQLLHKLPRTRINPLNLSAMNEENIALLNKNRVWTGSDEKPFSDAPQQLFIFADVAEITDRRRVATLLSKAKFPFRLQVHGDNSPEQEFRLTEPLTAQLTLADIAHVVIEQVPGLHDLGLFNCTDATVNSCPELHGITTFQINRPCKRLMFSANPALEKIYLSFVGKTLVEDSPRLKDFTISSAGEDDERLLELRRCGRIGKLAMRGTNLQLDEQTELAETDFDMHSKVLPTKTTNASK